MIHRNLTASRAELAADKADRNRGRGRGSGPGHPPKNFGLADSKLLEMLAGREAAEDDDDIMGDMSYRERREGGAPRRGKGLL